MRARSVATALFVGLSALVSSVDVSRAVAQAPSPPDPVLERWLTRAESLHAQGRDRPAILVLRRAMARASSDPRPVLSLGEIALPSEPDAPGAVEPPPRTRRLAGEIAEGLEAVDVEGDPTDPVYRAIARGVRTLGPWAVALTGDHRSAIERAAVSAGRMDHVAAASLRRLAALAIRRHDLIAADEALVAATRADPTDVDLITDLAAVRLARGDADDSVRLLLDALRRHPEDLAIERDLAGALLAAGRAGEAVVRLSAIADARPGDVRAALDLARAALEAGDTEKATRAARDATTHAARTDPEPLLVLAAARLAAGDESGARDAFREALRRAPDDLRAQRGLSTLDSGSR